MGREITETEYIHICWLPSFIPCRVINVYTVQHKHNSAKKKQIDGVMMRLGMHSYCIRKYLKRNKIKFHDFNFFSTIYRASGYFHGRRLLLFGGGVRRSTEHFPRSTAPRSTLHVHELPGPHSCSQWRQYSRYSMGLALTSQRLPIFYIQPLIQQYFIRDIEPW